MLLRQSCFYAEIEAKKIDAFLRLMQNWGANG